jgi:hypothetical protein
MTQIPTQALKKSYFSYFFMLSTIILFSCTSRKIVTNNLVTPAAHISCYCGANGSLADSTITLPNKKSISLCGLKTYSSLGTTFKNLTYGECNKSPMIILSPTNSYLPVAVKDTLYLMEMINLPMNATYAYTSMAILQQKIYFYHDSLQSSTCLNLNFPNYSREQILDIFEQYQQMEVSYDKRVSILMDKLFVSAISGNVLAVKTFKNFEAKFTNLTGEDKDRYIELLSILKKYLALNK